jgi:hypothetical protein
MEESSIPDIDQGWSLSAQDEDGAAVADGLELVT